VAGSYEHGHKMRGISLLAEELLASQEGLCSMELDNYLVGCLVACLFALLALLAVLLFALHASLALLCFASLRLFGCLLACLPAYRFEFRRHRSTTNHTLTIFQVIHKTWECNGAVHHLLI